MKKQPPKQQYLYKHGLPFSEKLALTLNGLKKRVFEDNKASLIIIDGGVGSGKTTCAVEVAEYIMSAELIFKEQLAMGGEEFRTKIKICFKRGYVVIIYDEAGDFDRRGAITRLNRMLNRLFEISRAFKILVILTLPDFSQLDSKLFDNRIPRLLLHCDRNNNNYADFRAYGLTRMYYIREKMTKLTIKSKAFSLVRPNFRGHFLDLSPVRSKELDEFTTKGKLGVLEEGEIKDANLKNMEDLVKALGRSACWITQKIKQLKIKPVKMYRKRKFYDISVIDLLYEQIKQR